MGNERGPKNNIRIDLPLVAGGSGDEPFVSRSAMRRKEMLHAELNATIQAIRSVDSISTPTGSGRGFRNVIKR